MDEQKKLYFFLLLIFFNFYNAGWFLPYNNANCTYIIIHTSPPSLASLPSPHPTPPGHHRAPDWAPHATQRLRTSYPSYLHLIVDVTLLICPTFSLPHVHKFILHIDISIPSLQTGGRGGGGSRHGAVPCPMGGARRPPTVGSSTGAKSKVISPYQSLEPQNHFISFQIPIRSGKQRQHKSRFTETRGPAAKLPFLCVNLGEVFTWSLGKGWGTIPHITRLPVVGYGYDSHGRWDRMNGEGCEPGTT